MIFHALRRDLGDEQFWGTLRRVAREAAGKRFSWADWQAAFEKTSGRNLAGFFSQWLDQPGAPLLELGRGLHLDLQGRMRVSGVIRQKPGVDGFTWRLTVPVTAEYLDGSETVLVDVSGEETAFSMVVPSLPLRVMVDPDYHVFRRLGPEEMPPCLAVTLERPKILAIHPDGDEALAAAAHGRGPRAPRCSPPRRPPPSCRTAPAC